MRVKVKDFAVNMQLGNNGVLFEVRDTEDKHLGDLRVGKAHIEWCKGRTREGNGHFVTWAQLIKWFESDWD